MDELYAGVTPGGMFHLSPAPRLSILSPQMPAEEVIGGILVWDDGDGAFPGVPCVCWGASPERILQANPCLRGFVYVPASDVGAVRDMAKEYPGADCDFSRVGEARTYGEVPVRCAGEFSCVPTANGLVPSVTWY